MDDSGYVFESNTQLSLHYNNLFISGSQQTEQTNNENFTTRAFTTFRITINKNLHDFSLTYQEAIHSCFNPELYLEFLESAVSYHRKYFCLFPFCFGVQFSFNFEKEKTEAKFVQFHFNFIFEEVFTCQELENVKSDFELAITKQL